jgi:hypothetical protein
MTIRYNLYSDTNLSLFSEIVTDLIGSEVCTDDVERTVTLPEDAFERHQILLEELEVQYAADIYYI